MARTSAPERVFKERVKKILSRTPDGPAVAIDEYWYLGTPINAAELEKAFFQYGTYLEMMGGDAPIEEPRVFVWPAPASAA